MTRTIYNCSVVQKQVNRGIGKPEQYYNLNKCLGYAKSDNNDEPCEICKRCRLHLSFEEE